MFDGLAASLIWSMTHEYIFNYKSNDIYWCTADIGWVTGHSYIIYGPLSNAATTIMFEGIPNYPNVSRWWQMIDKYKVNIFYTAPTAIRSLTKPSPWWSTTNAAWPNSVLSPPSHSDIDRSRVKGQSSSSIIIASLPDSSSRTP